MGTKSNKSAGSQITAKGITQGTTLVGPKSGLPIDEVVDNAGKRRLAVDAAVTIDNVTIDVPPLTAAKDQVSIGDRVSGNQLTIEPDGSINVNVELDAATGDSVLVVGSEDGTNTGTKHTAVIDSNKNLHVINMGQLVPNIFDAIAVTYPSSTQEVYTYKLGGIAGTTIAAVTVVYSDPSKNILVSVART